MYSYTLTPSLNFHPCKHHNLFTYHEAPVFFLLTRVLAELVILLAFYAVGRQLVLLFNLNIPPGVVGLILLLGVFALGWLSPEQLQGAAALLLGEMLLFFVPAVMSLLDHGTLIKNQGWKVILIIVVSSVLVMLGTAITVELICRWNLMRRWRKNMVVEWWKPWLWLLLTIGSCSVSRWLHRRKRYYILSPLLFVPIILFAFAVPLHTTYQEYSQNTRWLLLMLGPATVAFAIPIWKQRKLIIQHWLALSIGMLVGSTLSIISSFGLAHFG